MDSQELERIKHSAISHGENYLSGLCAYALNISRSMNDVMGRIFLEESLLGQREDLLKDVRDITKIADERDDEDIRESCDELLRDRSAVVDPPLGLNQLSEARTVILEKLGASAEGGPEDRARVGLELLSVWRNSQ